MPRTKLSIHYCEHVAGRHIVTYARLDLGAADPSDSATSLVINEKQLYRILYKDILLSWAHTQVHKYTHTSLHLLILHVYILRLQPWPLLVSRAMTPGIHPDNYRWQFNDVHYTLYVLYVLRFIRLCTRYMREPKLGYNSVIIPYTCRSHCICRQIDVYSL